MSVFLTGLAGWVMYDAMMAPRWMRDFGLEMAAKATIVSSRSEETAFSTMKGRAEPESPYICLADITSFDWDRVYVIGSDGQVTGDLGAKDWQGEDLNVLNRRMREDNRYQLIAFERQGQIIEQGFYFTMWADLTDLARPEGFTPNEAVFLADSDGEVYTLSVAGPASANHCTEM
jgi:hypothetical protein